MKNMNEVTRRIMHLEQELAMLREMRRRMEADQADIMTYLIAACLEHGATVEQAKSPARFRHIADARASFALRAYRAGFSRQAIAAAINKDRSSTYEMIERATWYKLETQENQVTP